MFLELVEAVFIFAGHLSFICCINLSLFPEYDLIYELIYLCNICNLGALLKIHFGIISIKTLRKDIVQCVSVKKQPVFNLESLIFTLLLNYKCREK